MHSLANSLQSAARITNAQTRSLSAENPTGAKGKGGMATEGLGASAARDLGQGWKVSPAVKIGPGRTFVVGKIDGPGQITQIWMAVCGNWRSSILRIYWDHQDQPSVETPVGDFFCCGWNRYAPLVSLPVCVNPAVGFNCYWPMPFRKSARITLENMSDKDMVLYYQVNYELAEVPDDLGYFHAQFRRANPLPYKHVHTILDGVRGRGQYLGTYMAWQVNNNNWWGEGEAKFYIDGDKESPTICGTGTEDYFCGSHAFNPNEFDKTQPYEYREFTTPYAGMHQVLRPDGVYKANLRFGLYRWHITDPVRFTQDLRVTMQALGWRKGGRYLPLQDDIASVAYWYQTLPTAPFPSLPDADGLEVI